MFINGGLDNKLCAAWAQSVRDVASDVLEKEFAVFRNNLPFLVPSYSSAVSAPTPGLMTDTMTRPSIAAAIVVVM